MSSHPCLLHTVVDTDDVRGSAEFWRQLLDLRYRDGDEVVTDGDLRLDRTDTPEEPLRAYADPAGRIRCIFVA